MSDLSGLYEAMAEHGLQPPPDIQPGKIHRFPGFDKSNGNKAGWCRLFEDCEGARFGDYSTGLSETWQAKRSTPRTQAEREAFARRVREAKAEAEAEQERRRQEGATRAKEIIQQAEPAPEDHDYLLRKGIKPYSLLVFTGRLELAGMQCHGALVAALYNRDREIAGVQFIASEGKRFLGPVAGLYFTIGKPRENEPVLITEGAATGHSLHEVTGCAVVVALNSGNLAPVAQLMRERFPDRRIVIAADDDWKTKRPNGDPWNPGIEAANAAARAIGGFVAVPVFGPDREEKWTDFNDACQSLGVAAVQEAVARVLAPSPVPEAQPQPEIAPRPAVEDSSPEPKAFPDAELRPVPPFTSELLPDSLGPWVMDISERLQCPPDFVAVSVVVALGSVIGRRVGIRPQELTPWTEYPNLWGCIVGRPSVMKSPALEQGQAPLRRLAAKAAERFKYEREDFEHKSHAAKMRKDAAEGEIRKRLKTSINADVSDLEIKELTEPKLQRYIANDTSYESLGGLLKNNPNGILVSRDELVSLLKTLDREDSAGARGFYLTGWAGNSPYTFDRITREGAALDAVCLSMLGSTQPGRIADYLRMAIKGGAGDDGLIQRFGLLVWPDTSREWKDVDRLPDQVAAKAAFDVFDRLDALDPLTVGAEQDMDFNGTPKDQPFLRLDPGGLAVFREWREAFERRLAGDEESPALVSHLAKYRKLVPALALIFHLADNGQGRVGSVAVLRALAWADYLEAHARRAYGSIGIPEHSAARAIFDRIKRGDLASPFRARDVYGKHWTNLGDRLLVADALELLTDLDWVSVSETAPQDKGGRPTMLYTVNPRGLAR